MADIDVLEPALSADAQEDLLTRGYSRRHLGRIAALLGGGIAAAQVAGPALAQQSAKAVAGAVRIGSNECWTGPLRPGAEAAMMIVSQGNRYEPDNEHAKLFAAVSQVEGVPVDALLPGPARATRSTAPRSPLPRQAAVS
ncbi:hypothetical protein NOVOSPHI9U_680012 [Novosphingobium sp. 9U]|nr:hypothetical protein NOVOSPHI9U_680012 [Novosphingobium sp. 9U]